MHDGFIYDCIECMKGVVMADPFNIANLWYRIYIAAIFLHRPWRWFTLPDYISTSFVFLMASNGILHGISSVK